MDYFARLAAQQQALRDRRGSLPRLAQRHREFLSRGQTAYAANLQKIHDEIARACDLPTLDQPA